MEESAVSLVNGINHNFAGAGGLLIGVLAASLVMFMGRKKEEQE